MISIVIPAYNEEEGIGSVIDKVNAVLTKARIKHEIIVVDDGSTDRTAGIVRRKKARLVQNPYNKGYGASLKTGIKNARGEWILMMDADGTYPEEEIPRMLGYAGEYDMVVGARTGKNVRIQSSRKPAKWFLTKLANYLTGRKIDDLNSGMRLFRKDEVMRFFSILPSGFSFTTTITLAYLINDYNVKYLPIDYRERKGRSKIKSFRDGANFLSLIIKVITYFKPLKIFLPISAILFLAGFVYLLYQVVFFQHISQAPVLLVLASFQIGFLGLLADMIARRG